ncbi:unnamed protein product [Toxocara canis]|uniref:ribonuclease H n=1 Tax=Toxocara canis TaxID=6265 RepID=A0A183UWU8_TOXCA|nr:unnamed protein product [Toxocara canis]
MFGYHARHRVLPTIFEMGDKFYAVAHGRKPGVYEDWNEAQKQIKDYPQPVYKKFATKEEAEEFFKVRQPERVSSKQLNKYNRDANMEVDESAKRFYAIARGKVIGIFTDFEEVKKHIADYPQPMYKKFEDLAEAKAYFEKYTTGDNHTEDEKTGKGIVEMGSTEKERGKEKSHKKEDSKNEDKDNSRDKDNSKEKVYYAVARGHKPGVYATWAECQEQTKDFKGAKFKKFTDEEEAKMFAEGKTLKQIEERKRPHEKDDEEDEVDHKKAAKEKEKA